MPIKIAIVDDHPLLIKGLLAMLQHSEDIEIVATYNNGRELLNGLKHIHPDVLLLDIQMPGTPGDEITSIVKRTYPDIMILALTNMEHEYYIKAMLNNGVHGYVLKSSDEHILLEAIRALSRGAEYFDPNIRKHVTITRKNSTRRPSLTTREKEILQLIASDLSSSEIAQKLFLSKRTVDNHRLNLLLKLGVKSSATMVKKAIDLGLLQ